MKFYGNYVILNVFVIESFKSKQFLAGMFLSAGMIKNSGWVIARLVEGDSLSVSLSLPLSFTDLNNFILSFFFSPLWRKCLI